MVHIYLTSKDVLKTYIEKTSLRAIQWWAHEMYLSHYPNMWPLFLFLTFECKQDK